MKTLWQCRPAHCIISYCLYFVQGISRTRCLWSTSASCNNHSAFGVVLYGGAAMHTHLAMNTQLYVLHARIRNKTSHMRRTCASVRNVAYRRSNAAQDQQNPTGKLDRNSHRISSLCSSSPLTYSIWVHRSYVHLTNWGPAT